MATYQTYDRLSTQEFFQGLLSGYNLTQETLKSVCLIRSVGLDDDYMSLSEKTRDLLKADLLCAIAMAPSQSLTVEDADGGWSHKECRGGVGVSDKSFLISQANLLYAKWGESTRSTGIKIINL